MNNGQVKESFAAFRTSQGSEVRANLLRFTRHQVALEIYHPGGVLQTSEVLHEFRIIWNDRTLYSGRAVVRTLLNTGLVTICEANLEDAWGDLDFAAAANGHWASQFEGFLSEWQKLYRIVPEFKVVIGDLQTFLTDLRLWLEQVELGIRSSPSADRAALERSIVDELAPSVVRAIDSFIERFEAIVGRVEPELQPAHQAYLRRQLHPLILCSPFAYRTYSKPLGYAGDYEMVDMMLRPPHEGSTLFAKMINVWLLSQAPVRAHRNRIAYLTEKLIRVGLRARAQDRLARVYSLGCGPAVEIQQFLRESELSQHAQFTLLDFNEETLQHARGRLEETQRRHGRSAEVQLVRKSVHQLLKESARSVHGPQGQYDLVYCAGLFDYLSDQVCKRLMNICYDLVAPGGLVVVTNASDAMNASRPFRYSMEYILDWYLVYRDGRQVTALAPEAAAPDQLASLSEEAGVNVFLEVRKPPHA